MQKSGIFGILEYSELFPNFIGCIFRPCPIYENRQTLCNPGNSEPWHIDNPGIFRILTYLKPDKTLYLRSLTGSLTEYVPLSTSTY